jgi:hypothetical protein
LTRIALVALSDAILVLDQQTVAHDRHGMDPAGRSSAGVLLTYSALGALPRRRGSE